MSKMPWLHKNSHPIQHDSMTQSLFTELEIPDHINVHLAHLFTIFQYRVTSTSSSSCSMVSAKQESVSQQSRTSFDPPALQSDHIKSPGSDHLLSYTSSSIQPFQPLHPCWKTILSFPQYVCFYFYFILLYLLFLLGYEYNWICKYYVLLNHICNFPSLLLIST